MKPEPRTVPLTSRAGDALAIVEGRVEHLQEVWLRGEFFEQRLLEYIYWHFKGDVFVDVGSAIGNHSLFFAKFCGAEHVVSIEPIWESAERQARLFKLNDVEDKVVIFTLALSNEMGWGRMEPFGGRNLGQFRLVPDEAGSIAIDTLDRVLEDIPGRVTLVKIDVEGHELQVLEGGRETLHAHRPALFVEIRSHQSKQAITEFLASFGYIQIGSMFQDATVYEFGIK